MSSSSPPMLKPIVRAMKPAVAQQADSPFMLLENHSECVCTPAPKTDGPKPEQLHALTSVVAGVNRHGTVSRAGGKRKGKKNGKDELNKSIGNDSSIPWMRNLRDRSVVQVMGGYGPTTVLTTSAAPTFGSFVFYVGLLDNFASWATTFDEYCVKMLEIIIYPQITEVVTTAADVGTYVTAIDIDDSSTPTSVNQVNSYPSSQMSSGTLSHFHRWAPKYSLATYSGAFTSYSTEDGWVDCASPNVQFYGLKTAAPGVVVAQTYNMDVRFTLLLRGIH